MSQRDVELVRKAFYPPGADLVQLFADRDAVAAWLEPFVHPDLETRTAEKDPSIQSGTGLRAFVNSYAEWLSVWETFHATPVELHDLGDRVLVIVRMGGKTKTHGAEVEQWSAVIFEVSDGLVRTVKFFTTADEARREAGLVA